MKRLRRYTKDILGKTRDAIRDGVVADEKRPLGLNMSTDLPWAQICRGR